MKKLFISILIANFTFSTNTQGQEYLNEKYSGYEGEFNSNIRLIDESFNFIVMGDFGRMGGYHQIPVAKAMANVAITTDAEFILSVGDNFYPNGVASTDDPQWKYSFEDIYKALSLHIDWYVALGNHDYRGNVQAQIDYSKISRRWQMPSNYYAKKFELDNGENILMIVLDSNPFIDSYHEDPENYPDIKVQDTAAQIRWLKQVLSEQDTSISWKIVVGHHPLYSGGKRKNSKDTEAFKTKMVPIFEKYGVDMYLCGHEHDLQIIKPENSTLQLLSGSASEIRPSGNTEGTIFAAAEPGFMLFSLQDKKAFIQVIKSDNSVLYTYEIQKKQ